MKRWLIAAVVMASASVAFAGDAKDPLSPLYGTWRGTSKCTAVRPACHDEIAVCHIAKSSKPNSVAMTMNKVIDGAEVEMGGTVDFTVDVAKHQLRFEFTTPSDHKASAFRFTWSDRTMTGTLVQLPGGEVVRNIKLVKE